MTILKEVKSLIKRIRIIGWIALFATLVLIVELNLIVTSVWATLDLQNQLTILGITATLVIALGFSRKGPDGFIKGSRGKRK
jgi:hypothetical protein